MRTGIFGILLSALRSMGQWTWRPIVIKFAVMFGLFYVVSAMLDYLLEACGLSTAQGVCGLNIGVITGLMDYLRTLDLKGLRFFLNMVAFPLGFKLLVCALATRFFIRRLPVVG